MSHRVHLVLLLLSIGLSMPAPASFAAPVITTDDDTILVDGQPLFLKGVCYSPFIAGSAPWTGSGKVVLHKDVKEMKDQLHANAVRIYDPLPNTFYEAARTNGVWVIQGIFLPDDAASHAQDAPAFLQTPAYIAAQKAKIQSVIDSIHAMNVSDTILAYVLGNRLSSEVVANTIRSASNQARPRFKGVYYQAPDANLLPDFDTYPGCVPPPPDLFPGGVFPDPHPFQSFLAELADFAADYEQTRYGVRRLIGHSITPVHSSFLGARDRPVPGIQTPVDMSFLDVVFENIATYDFPYITYYGFPAYLERLKTAYPHTPVVVLETGYSTSPSFFPPNQKLPEPLCGFSDRTPQPLSMSFGGLSDVEQAAAIEARWLDVVGGKRRLGGMFVYNYYDEWWLTGAINVQEDHPLEHSGLKRVSGTPGNFTVVNKPAFFKLARLYGCEEPDADAGACGLAMRLPRALQSVYEMPFSLDLAAEGGKLPYRWSVENPAALPEGVAFSASPARLEGTPRRMGHFRFRLRVEDGSTPPLSIDRLSQLSVGPPEFTTRGREIFMNGAPFYLNGIDYSPLIAGDAPWSSMTQADPFHDLREIKETLHANSIRVYQPLPKSVYDAARANGLFIVQGVHLQIDGAPHPGEPDCLGTELDLWKNPLRDTLRKKALADVEEVHRLFGSDTVLSWVIGNEVNFCVQRSTIQRNQDRPRYKGVYYSVPDGPPRLPDPAGCAGCQTEHQYWDPHPFQSFICQLVDAATGIEIEKYGTRHLMAHATDPNMSIAVGEKHRFHSEVHFPVDMSFLDIVYQNVYGYFPPYLRYFGYDDYLEECRKAYPDTPFVILECGYSTSPSRDGDIGHCAEGPTCCMEKEGIAAPEDLSLCFGLNGEEDQARGLAAQYRKAVADPGLTAGFFVFEYYDEWWKGGNASEFVHDENRSEEWFGIQSVLGVPGNYKVVPRLAFETVRRMFDRGWCPAEGSIAAVLEAGGVRLRLAPGGGGEFDDLAILRDGTLIHETGPTLPEPPTIYFDAHPPPGERKYAVIARNTFAECTPLEIRITVPPAELFRRGDANRDRNLDISDAVATLSSLFLGSGPLACEDAADADDNGALEITDAVFTLQRLFLGGAAIPPPGPDACGSDPTPDGLSPCNYDPGLCNN